jgi:hypothetical protein
LEASKELDQYFDELVNINKEPVDLAKAMKNTRENLLTAAKEIGDRLANRSD